MKVIAIFCLIAICIGGASFGQTYNFMIDFVDVIKVGADAFGYVFLPDASLTDISYLPTSTKISNPIINPNDDMYLCDFLYMQHKAYINANFGNVTGLKLPIVGKLGIDVIDLYGSNVYLNVDKYIHFIKFGALGTLDVDYQGYKKGDFVYFTYKVPCVRYVYKGTEYFMLNPLVTDFTIPFKTTSMIPISWFIEGDFIKMYCCNQVKKTSNFEFVGILGAPDTFDSLMNLSIDFKDYFGSTEIRTVVEKSTLLTTEYLGGYTDCMQELNIITYGQYINMFDVENLDDDKIINFKELFFSYV